MDTDEADCVRVTGMNNEWILCKKPMQIVTGYRTGE
jgi:hypothetical protein